MNSEVLLDHHGNLVAPPGYKIITSEVDFLRWATDNTHLLIRGQSLCEWAEAFYNLRGRPYHYQESIITAIQRTFPSLSLEQARELSQRIGLEDISQDQVTVTFILNRCYPADFLVWQGDVSTEHSARWLLWLYSHEPSDIEIIILEQFSHILETQAGNAPERNIYSATTREKAQSLIDAWFGLSDDGVEFNFGEFPLSVPPELLSDIKSKWNHKLIESEGGCFKQMLSTPLPITLRQEIAKLTAHYYEQHTKYLTHEIIRQLQPYLSIQTLSKLEVHLPRQKPTPIPQEEVSVIKWFQSEYLPYRWWQSHFGDANAMEYVLQTAQDFIYWYLKRYPQWLIQSEWISFQQTTRLRNMERNSVIFCIILDGLPSWDAEDFTRMIFNKVDRLQLEDKSYFFAPLPTVTVFAKDAMLKGVPPRLVENTPPLGKIIPDNSSPMHELIKAKPGDLIFWRLAQPDNAYHFESDAKRERQVRAELETIIQALKEITDNLPDTISLKIIITSDHGRLLNPKSPRRLPIPNGMQAHGRVAWGNLDQKFDETGFIVDENAGWIAIHGERFEMSSDMLIALYEDSFQNIKSGSEPYPHGGLFPEEAIIPWFVFERDAQLPSLQITVSGKGEAGNTGTIIVTILNPNRINYECLSISLSHGVQVSGYWNILPLDKTKFTIEITPWPSKTNLKSLNAVLLFRQPNGGTFMIEVSPSLEIITLYERDDNLLKDLEL